MSKKIIFCLILSVLFFGQLKMVSNAAETEYFLSYPQPATDGGHGYISVEVQDISTGSRFIDTWFFSAFADVGGQQSPAEMAVTVRTDTINFALARPDNANSWYTVNLINGRGLYTTMFRAQSNANMYNYSSNGYRIINFVYGGSCFVTNYVNRTDTVNVYYDESGSAILLRGQLSLMIDQNARDQKMLDAMWNIMNSNNGINDRVEALTKLQGQTNSKLDENNTWLEKIFNFLEEKDEKDKQDATQQGTSSTSQGMDAIDDKGGDFANSLGGLTNSMSYSGTQCAWEFPEVKIPAISGVMNEVVLIQRQPIDFAKWVNAIPSDILLVVQSVCTIGLIVYCFKELYNTIAYVLTLRRDDNE